MADKNEVLDNFVNITGVDKDRAKFYLEASAWNLELAMASFYEGDGEDDQGDVGLGIQGHPAPVVEPPAAGGSGGPRQVHKPASRFATIGNMRDDSGSSEEEGQAFYAGGSEHSGQQVLGPKKKNKNIVEDLFKSARDHGAEEVGKDDEDVPRPRQRQFVGSGYRLGDTEGQASEVIRGASSQPQRKQVDCVLKLWKDGFSVDDGPLRDFKDPANKEFLNSITKGEVPQELIREAKGGEVNLNMEDHRTEDYVKPKVPMKAFTGEGHTLGSPAPTVVQSPPSQPAQAQGSASSVKADESKPHTTIQIRLADGSRMVGKFNHSHTVADIRSHIVSSRPQYAGVNFILQTTFPNRELSNTSETVEQAKLLNAVVVQRLK